MRNTKIEWASDTINPIRARDKETGKVGWFCEHVTPGCEHCYAERMNRRLGTGINFKRQYRDRVELFLDDKLLTDPLRWRSPRRIFWNSMTDTFGDFVPDGFIDRQIAVMALTPQHTHLVLTKRAKRMQEYMTEHVNGDGFLRCGPLPNVYLGVSVEDQARADERIPDLLATPAAVRFISAEPLLGPIDLRHITIPRPSGHPDWLNAMTGEWIASQTGCIVKEGAPLDWIIVGGESGAGARAMHPAWSLMILDQCRLAGVPFFFKQWGEWLPDCQSYDPGPYAHANVGHMFPDGLVASRVGKKSAGRKLDGREHNELPA